MNNKPLVSVIVPAYNAEKTILQCINALNKQSMDRELYEIIVVDNNSSDNTASIIKSCSNVRYLMEAEKGSASARNRGIKYARGKIIAFTDADCVPSAKWLELITQKITDGKCDVCGGEVEPVSVEKEIERFGKAWFWPVQQIINGELFYYPYVITANAAYRSDIIRKVNGFDQGFPVAGYEDADLGWRSYFAGARFYYVPEAVVLHHHRTTLEGLFYMGYKGGFGREILINKFRERGVPGKNLFLSFLRLIRYALFKLPVKSGSYEKPVWYIYDMTFRIGQLWGSIRGKQYIRHKIQT